MSVLVIGRCSQIHFLPFSLLFVAQRTTLPRFPYLPASGEVQPIRGSGRRWRKSQGISSSPCFQPGLRSICVSSLAAAEQPCMGQFPLAGQRWFQLLCGGPSSWAPGTLPSPPSRRRWLPAVANLWGVLPLLLLYNQIPDLNPSGRKA